MLAGLLLLFLYLPVFISGDLADLSGDSARYILLGKALARARGFVEMDKPEMPPHTEYGPALPWLISLLIRSGACSLTVFKMLPAGSLVLCFWLSFRLGKVELGSRLSAALACLVLASIPYMARFSNMVMSDLPYTAFSLASLLLVCVLLSRRSKSGPLWTLTGLVLGSSFLFRQVGMALWLGALAGTALTRSFSMRERARVMLFLSLGFLAPALGWFSRNLLVAGSVDPVHLDKLFQARASDPFAGALGAGGILRRVGRGVPDYFQAYSKAAFDMSWPLVHRPIRLAAAAAVLAPALLGFFGRLLRRRGPVEWYALVYVLIILAWQSHYPRYLVPLIPLGCLYFLSGLEYVLGAAKCGHESTGAGRRTIVLWVLLLLSLFNLGVFVTDLVLLMGAPETPAVVEDPSACNARAGLDGVEGRRMEELAGRIKWGRWYQYPEMLKNDPEEQALRYHRLIAAARWAGRELAPGSVMAARKPRLTAFYSGRPVLQFPPETRPGALARKLERMGVTHVLADEASAGARLILNRVILEMPGFFSPVFSIGDTHVLGLKYRNE